MGTLSQSVKPLAAAITAFRYTKFSHVRISADRGSKTLALVPLSAVAVAAVTAAAVTAVATAVAINEWSPKQNTKIMKKPTIHVDEK